MTNQSVIRLKLTIPTSTEGNGNGAVGGEGKTYILTLALSVEGDTEECDAAIQLQPLEPWTGEDSLPTQPGVNGEVMPPQEPPAH